MIIDFFVLECVEPTAADRDYLPYTLSILEAFQHFKKLFSWACFVLGGTPARGFRGGFQILDSSIHSIIQPFSFIHFSNFITTLQDVIATSSGS